MDPTKIVVLVLSLMALGFLVWVEMNSRRNTRALKEKQPESNADSK